METLKSLRLQSGKSRTEVATALSVKPNAVTNYESGLRTVSLEQVLILAELYDVSEKDIILAQLKAKEN